MLQQLVQYNKKNHYEEDVSFNNKLEKNGDVVAVGCDS